MSHFSTSSVTLPFLFRYSSVMQVNVEFLGWSCHGKLLFRYRVVFRYAGKCYIPCVPIRDPAEGKREHAKSPVRVFVRGSLLLPLFFRYSSLMQVN